MSAEPGCAASPTLRRVGLRVCLLAVAFVSVGCAGGGPLLHPAQVLPAGEVRASTGFSGQAGLGGLSSAMRDARAQLALSGATGQGSPEGPVPSSAAPTTDPRAVAYAKGALVAASVAPGLAPFVAARVGIDGDFEGGLAYTGRGVRLDGRRAFELARGVALSAGVGGSAAFYGRSDAGPLPGLDLGELRGYGADVPVLVGWVSEAGLYRVWAGVRGGYERVTVSRLTAEPKLGFPAGPAELEADRFHGGGLVGLAAGFRRVHVAMELDAAYQSVSGRFGGASARIQGVSLTPATALWITF